MSILLCRFRLGGGMMERLTEIQSGGYDLKAMNSEWCNKYCEQQRVETCNECGIYQAIQKLAEYEDLDEQGLLLRLPTEAYFIKDNIVRKGWVQELVYSPCSKLLLDIRYDDSSLDSYRGYLGNDVFLTQSEAEQKLKEMESD